jgi:methylmalonyl-CoA epimerase
VKNWEAKTMKVEKIDHIHIFVKNQDKAINFFEAALGTKFSSPRSSENLDAKTTMDPLGLEIIEGISPEGPVKKTIERRGEGLAAVSLKVPDIEEAITRLESLGVRLVRRIENGKIKEAQFHPKDTFGVMIELCEYELEHGALIASSIGRK